MTTEDKAEPPELPLHKLAHVQQRFSWDCGVSCVMMLLSEEQRRHFMQNFDAICREEGFNQSTWTIDLCYLLKRFGIEHTMYTTMPGVNEDYKKHSYYNKILDLDRDRVRRRFAEASAAGVRVKRHAITTHELVDHLLRRGPAILLVDASRLACDCCKHAKLTVELRRWLGYAGGYRGHYIVVTGAAGARGGRLQYADPARPRACAAPPRALARARAAAGTDYDTILVHRGHT